MSTTAAMTPDEVVQLVAAALHDGRIDDALALYEPDAVFVPQPDAQPISGQDAIRAALTGFVALRPTMTADIRRVVVAGEIATVLNAWQLRGTSPAGDLVAMAGISADVMRRRVDGTWGILIDDPWGAPPRSEGGA
ncbi:MAG TPA: SgcJ/EcaC family oxidoreductase [Micromonosporaceae bacterium]|nr:SgcJ/EcaC family oxidoreductase [Micromonosporaceae bacterium]